MKSPCQANLSIFSEFIDKFSECVDSSNILIKKKIYQHVHEEVMSNCLPRFDSIALVCKAWGSTA